MLRILESVLNGSPFYSYVMVEFDTTLKTSFNLIFLRDNCTCTECQHPDTKQRIIDVFGKNGLKQSECHIRGDALAQEYFAGTQFEVGELLVCKWAGGHTSKFTKEWLLVHSYAPPLHPSKALLPERSTWDAKTFEQLRQELDHNSFQQMTECTPRVLHNIYEYGFAFVNEVPVTLKATKEVSESISIIRPTHYDLGLWDFTSDLAKKDTAYTSLAIDMHTDGNYWYEPPGLQLFHLLEHSGGKGGETRIVDVAKVLEVLVHLAKADESWRGTFDVLTSQPLSFYQAGEESSVYTQDQFPVLTISEKLELLQCRWNNSDRSPKISLPCKFPTGQVYEALFRFNSLVNDPKYYVQFQLKPGQILIFDNWRVLHARNAFSGFRRLCGSYLTRDDFLARLRCSMNDRKTVLDTI
ncbi:LAQU0S02e02872g1_1 [Lachancea quebecensis]|uniref:trimethyllysine dioxygenase n=1 Tax=Lachancea quebecensis TaxID=1654605 RepID=A0A0N7ML11_9SACH|nr:LAQU0S02e02872g1_1 [Lachancea quebecensis]